MIVPDSRGGEGKVLREGDCGDFGDGFESGEYRAACNEIDSYTS